MANFFTDERSNMTNLDVTADCIKSVSAVKIEESNNESGWKATHRSSKIQSVEAMLLHTSFPPCIKTEKNY
jgi:hypothetical protein